MMLTSRFPTPMNFMDPTLTNDGQPYGPTKYKELVRNNYLISKNCNTSYTDVLQLTPRERDYIIEFIIKDADDAKKLMEENRRNLQSFKQM